jgi:hypothetical protein
MSTQEVEGQGVGERQWRKSVDVAPLDRPATWLGFHLAPNQLLQVSGAPPWPYKYAPIVEMRRHIPHFGDSTCKALILSVVARRSLVGAVARLRGPEGPPACWEPSS